MNEDKRNLECSTNSCSQGSCLSLQTWEERKVGVGPSPSGNRAILPSDRAIPEAGRGSIAAGPGQLGQQPEWRQRHSSEPSHQLHNKVIMGLGIKLVTCVIIFLRTRAEGAFLRESLLGRPKSTDSESQMSVHRHKHRHPQSNDGLAGEATLTRGPNPKRQG